MPNAAQPGLPIEKSVAQLTKKGNELCPPTTTRSSSAFRDRLAASPAIPAIMSMSLRSFLAAARAALATPAADRVRPLTFVVGNESAGERLHPTTQHAYIGETNWFVT